MATLYIAEFKDAQETAKGFVTSQTVTVGAASAQSAAFDDATRRIRIVSDTACQFEIWGTSPTADATSPFLPANAVEYFSVDKEKAWKLTVIQQQ